MSVYFFQSWHKHFERAQARRLTRLPWIPQSTNFGHDLYLRILQEKNGVALYGAYRILAAYAATCKQRGALIARDGAPLTLRTLSQATNIPQTTLRWALPKLLAAGALQQADTLAAATAQMNSERLSEDASEQTSEQTSEHPSETGKGRRIKKDSSLSSSSPPGEEEPPVEPDELTDAGRQAVCRALRGFGVDIDLAEQLSARPSVRLWRVEQLGSEHRRRGRDITAAAWFVSGLRHCGALPAGWRGR